MHTSKRLLFILLIMNLFSMAQNSTSDSLKFLLANQTADTSRVKILSQLINELRYKNSDEAEMYAKQCIALGAKTKQYKDVGNAYKNMGVIYDQKEMSDKSINAYLKAISIFKSINDSLSISKCEVNIGKLYLKAQQNDKAKLFFKKSIPTFEKFNFALGKSVALENIAICYYNKQQFDTSLLYFTKASEFNLKNNIFQNTVVGNIANCYRNLKQYGQAKIYYEKYFNLPEDNQQGDYAYNMYLKNYAQVLIDGFNDNKKAVEILLHSKENLKNLHSELTSPYIEITYTLAQTQYKLQKYKESYDNLEEAYLLSSKMNLANLNAKMLELNEKNETEKKELLILKINQEKKLLFERDQQRTYFIYALLVIAILLLIILFISIRRYHYHKRDAHIIKQQKTVLEQKNKEKDALVQEIHHRVKNNLQFVSSLLNMQTNSSKNEQEVYSLTDASRRVRAMALVHEMLYNQEELTGVEIKKYLEELVKSINELINTNKLSINFILDIENQLLDTNKSIALGMITSELVSNSIKYAFVGSTTGEITIILKTHHNKVTFIVKDNGIGFSQNNKLAENKLGMRLINIFSRQVEGDYEINGNTGVVYTLFFEI